jgi:hypothetical protein
MAGQRRECFANFRTTRSSAGSKKGLGTGQKKRLVIGKAPGQSRIDGNYSGCVKAKKWP